MKKVSKFFLRVLLLLTLLFVVFYFWASSSTLSKESYSELIKYNFPKSIDTDSVYSIVTYNIGYLSGMTNNKAVKKTSEHKAMFVQNLKKAIVEIERITPDIIAFQEIDYDASRSYNVNQEEEIVTLGYNYVAKGVNWDKRYLPFPYWPLTAHFGKVVSGQSVLSKYPIKEYERIALDRVEETPFYIDRFYIDRLLQVVKITLEGKDVIVMNVHLEAFDKPTRVKQFKYVLNIFNTYKKEYPTILLGDFNSQARDKEAVINEMFRLKDVGNAAFEAGSPENTFDSRNPTQRIDYIFYTKKSIKYMGGKVLNQFSEISDHLPLEMQFKLNR